MAPSADADLKMKLEGNLSELPRMNAQVQAWGERLKWTQSTIFRTQFVLEELFVNAITHGRHEGQTVWASFSLKPMPQGLEIQWRDNGVAFNPLLTPLADPNVGLDERQPGGWGLTMVRGWSQDAHYQRQAIAHEDVNCLGWLQPWGPA